MRIARGRECGRDATELADELAAMIKNPDVGPLAVPVRWETTTRPVVDISSGLTMTPQRRAFAGLDDDRTVQRLTGQFRAIPTKRAVIVGEPGSGRTSVARLLAKGLLAARREGRAVPVVLPLDGWDPVTEPLPGWIVGSLADRYYKGRRDVPQRLFESELLLPFLDGLDAIAEPVRARAVLELDRLIGTARPVVLTCRQADFDGLLRGGCPSLHDTPVFTLLPVAAGDLAPFPELEQLHDRLDGPVGQALSTPLFVTMARRVPARLADLRDLATRLQVESRLLEGFVAELTEFAPPGHRRRRRAPQAPELSHQRVREWLAGTAAPPRRRRIPRLRGLSVVAALAALTLWATALIDAPPADLSRATLPISGATALTYSPDGRTLTVTTPRGETRTWDLADAHWTTPDAPLPAPLDASLPGTGPKPGTPSAGGEQSASMPGMPELGTAPVPGVVGNRTPFGVGAQGGAGEPPVVVAADLAGRFGVARAGRFLVLRDGWRRSTHRMPLPKTRSLRIDAMVFASDGSAVATAGDRARFWNPLAHRMLPGSFSLGGDPVVAFAAGPDRGTIAVATAQEGRRASALTFWSVKDKRPLGPARTLGTRTPLLAYSPSNDTVAVVPGGRAFRFYDAAADRGLGGSMSGHEDGIRALAFSPDGRTLATTDGHTVKLWDVP